MIEDKVQKIIKESKEELSNTLQNIKVIDINSYLIT
jgi:hypothetical protein